MFLDLANLLNSVSSQENELKNILLIENAESNKACFMIGHQISTCLKSGHQVCLVALSQTFTHYMNIAKKMTTNLSSYIQNNSFVFINELEHISRPNSNEELKIGNIDGENLIKNLFLTISETLMKFTLDKKKYLIIDDISLFLSLGCDSFLISLMINNLLNLQRQDKNFSFMNLVHVVDDNDEEINKLQLMLVRQHDIIIIISPLKTGYCRDITGQICVEWMKENDMDLLPASRSQKRCHYKLTDRTCTVFPIGLSTALL